MVKIDTAWLDHVVTTQPQRELFHQFPFSFWNNGHQSFDRHGQTYYCSKNGGEWCSLLSCCRWFQYSID